MCEQTVAQLHIRHLYKAISEFLFLAAWQTVALIPASLDLQQLLGGDLVRFSC